MDIIDYIANNAYIMFFLVHFVPTFILAWGTMNLIIAFSEALHFSVIKMHKGKVIGLFAILYISISIAYRDSLPHLPVYTFFPLSILLGCLLGVLWTFIFLKLPKALGRKLRKPRIYYLWILISSLAFAGFLFRYNTS